MQGRRKNCRRLEVRAEHVTFVFRQLICLRTVTQIVNRYAATQVDVLERVASLAMNRDEMFLHALERFGERLNVRRLRADVNVNTAYMNEVRPLQTTPKRGEHFGRRNTKLRRQQRGL